MAEGFARYYHQDKLEVYSAGTIKSSLNPLAVEVMAQKDIDISQQYSKSLKELSEVTFDYVVTVCDNAKETCPYFPHGQIIHKSFEDPPHETKNLTDKNEILKVYKDVRDQIEDFIKSLCLHFE